MMEYKDYYTILGVGKDASKDEIQRAYRKLARKYHPDVNKAADAQAKFIEINEAYEVLKDPEKRQRYDQFGHSWRDAQPGQPPPGGGERFSRSFHSAGGPDFNFQGEGFSDFFQNLFGGLRGDFSEGRRSPFDFGTGQRARASEAELGVSLDEAFHGATKTISLQDWVPAQDGTMQPHQRILQVKIPRGVRNGSVIRLAGQGGTAAAGMSASDLLCTIRIMPHHLFRVIGHDLHTIVEITPWEAALGGKVEVHTVEGKVKLKIPEGTRNGRRFHLRGKGLPRQSGAAGDIIVTVEIRVPHPLSDDEKKLFEKLAEKSKFNPRSKGGQRASDDGEI